MRELALHFEFEKDTDLDQAAAALQEHLSKLEAVGEVATEPEKPRLTGLEIAGAIAVTIEVVRGGRKLVVELRKLMPEIKRLIKEVKGLRDAALEVGPSMVPVAAVSDQHLKQIAAEGEAEKTRAAPARRRSDPTKPAGRRPKRTASSL